MERAIQARTRTGHVGKRGEGVHRKTPYLLESLEPRLLLSTTNWTGNVDNLWSEAGNWDNGVPGANDTAVINKFGATVSVDQDVDIATLQILEGAVDGDGWQFNIAKDLTVSGAGASFDADDGLLVIDGGGHSVVTISSTATFDDVQLLKTDTRMYLQVNGTMNVGGDLAIGDGVHAGWGINQIEGDTIDVTGNVITYDTSVGGYGTIKLNGPDHTISGGGRLPVVDIAAGETEALSDFGCTDLIVSGTLKAEGKQVTISRDLSVNAGGEFDNSDGTAGTLKIDGGGHSVATIDVGATTSFFDLLLDKSDNRMHLTVNGQIDVANDLTIDSISAIYGDTIAVAGDVHTNDSTVEGDATILLNGPDHYVYGDGDLSDLEVSNGTTTIVGDVGVESLRVLTGGVLNAGGGTLGIGEDFTVSGGTFNHDNGTIVFDEASHTNVSIGNTVLNNVELAKTDSRMYLHINSDLDVNGDLTITQISAIMGTIKVAGDVSTSDTSLSPYHGLIIMDGRSQALNATASGAQVCDLQIAQWSYGVVNVGTSHAVTVNDDLTITGNYNINDGTIKVLGDVHTTDNGVAGTGTVEVNGDHDITTDGDGGELPHLLISGGTTDASGAVRLGVQSLTINDGATFIAPPPGTQDVYGDFIVDPGGTYNHNNGKVRFLGGGSGTISIDSPETNTLYDMEVAKGSWNTITVSGMVVVENDLTLTGSGSTRLKGGTIVVEGDVVTTTPVYNGSDATIKLNGSHNINAGDETGGLPNVLVTGAGTTVTCGSMANVTVVDLTVEGGASFTAPGSCGSLNIKHDFTVNSTFNHNNGLVKFVNPQGSPGTVSIGSTDLYDVELAMGSYSSITIGSTMDVENDLTITGSGSSKLHGGTAKVKGDVTTSTVGFNGTGTIEMIGNSSNLQATATWASLPHLVINKGTWNTVTVIGDVEVKGDLTVKSINQINGGNIKANSNVVTTDLSVGGDATIKFFSRNWFTHQINATGQSGELPNVHIVTGNGSHGATTAVNAGSLGVQSLTVDNGTFTAPSTRLDVSGDLTLAAGATFNHNNGLVKFDGGGAKTIDTNSSTSNTLNDMEIATDSWSTRTISGTVYVDDDLTLSASGSATINGGTIKVGDEVVTTWTGTGTATVQPDGTHNISGGGNVPDLLVTGVGTVVNVNDDLGVRSLTVQDNATLNAAADTGLETLSISKDFTVSSGGTFNSANGTVKFVGGSGTVSIGSTHLYDAEIALGSWSALTIGSTMAVDNDLSITGSGSSNLNGGTAKVKGDVSTSSVGFGGSGTIEMIGHGDSILQATNTWASVPHLEINKSYSYADVDVTGDVEVKGDLTISRVDDMSGGGSIKANSHVVTTDTDVTGNATIKFFSRSWFKHEINAGGEDGELPNVEIVSGSGSHGSTTAADAGTLGVQSLTVSGGEFTAPASDSSLEIAHNFTVSGGTFAHNGGTVKFVNDQYHDGIVNIGSTDLNDVTLAMSSYGDLSVTGTMHVGGDLVIQTGSKLDDGTVEVSGDVTTKNAGFHGTGTIKFVGDNDQALGAGSTGQLPNVEIAKGSGTLTLQDTIEVQGNWTYTSGTVNAGTSHVVFVLGNCGSATVDASTMSFYDVSVKLGSWAGLTIASNLNVSNDFVMNSSGSANLLMEHGGGDIIVGNNLTLTNGGLRVDAKDQTTGDNLITYVSGTRTGTFSSVSIVNNAGGLSLSYGVGSNDVIKLV